MKRKTTHMKLKGAGLALAIALVATAAAHGTSTGYAGQERAVWNPDSPWGATVVVARSPGPATLGHIEGTDGRTVEQRAVAATRQGGPGWPEAAIWAGSLLGILLLGLWGDVAIGAVIVGAATLLGAGAMLVTRKPRGDRARSASGRRPRAAESNGV